MARNYVQPGDTVNWTNGTGEDVEAGEVVVMGAAGDATLGVALVDIANGESGAVGFGVFEVAKVDAAIITQGESLVWDSSVGQFDDNAATPATGDVSGPSAMAFESKGATTDETMLVKFTGVPGTLTGA